MDVSSMTPSPLTPLITAIERVWWLIPLVLLVLALRVPVVKGYLGELLVRFQIRLMLDKATYRRVHNVTLVTADGTTQIDHVILSPFGLFVLETKNMRGWIFGNEHQAQWTQKIYRYTTRFQNPLRQNYKHVKAIEALLQVPPETIHSVVTFVGNSTFKTTMPPNVTIGAGAITYIKSFRQAVFTPSQVTGFVQALQSGRLAPTLATHRDHVRHLEHRLGPNTSRRCHKCGSPMVLRTIKGTSKAGQQYWACSTFPKCGAIQRLP